MVMETTFSRKKRSSRNCFSRMAASRSQWVADDHAHVNRQRFAPAETLDRSTASL
jgi:hypothetical protein